MVFSKDSLLFATEFLNLGHEKVSLRIILGLLFTHVPTLFFAHKIININNISDEYLGTSVTRDQLRIGFSLFLRLTTQKC